MKTVWRCCLWILIESHASVDLWSLVVPGRGQIREWLPRRILTRRVRSRAPDHRRMGKYVLLYCGFSSSSSSSSFSSFSFSRFQSPEIVYLILEIKTNCLFWKSIQAAIRIAIGIFRCLGWAGNYVLPGEEPNRLRLMWESNAAAGPSRRIFLFASTTPPPKRSCIYLACIYVICNVYIAEH